MNGGLKVVLVNSFLWVREEAPLGRLGHTWNIIPKVGSL